MTEDYADIIISFCKKYNCVLNTTITEEAFRRALLEVPNNGHGLSAILKVNNSYFSHEFNRKINLEIKKQLNKAKTPSWFLAILLYYDKCPICGNPKKRLENSTCSYSCANKYFRSGVRHPNYVAESKLAYITICFSYHKKECIICGESNIVSVHHFDENHNNNSPDNLIPMCPTHHQYMHSKWKDLILDKVVLYRKNFISNNA